MPFTPAVPSRAVTQTPLRTAIAATLAANATLTTLVGAGSGAAGWNIFRDLEATGNPPLYVLVAIPSDVADLDTYTSTYIDAVVDVQAVALAFPGDADLVAYQIAVSLYDTAWSVAGYDVNEVRPKGRINRSTLIEGRVTYYVGHRMRVIARKQ